MDGFRPTYAVVNLNNLIFNFKSVKEFIGKDLSCMAVVKANAYGHGAIECAKALEKEKIECFGVALPEEGVELRQNGIKSEVICLGGFWQGQGDLLLRNHLSPVVYRLEAAEELNRCAGDRKTVADIHLKIDTGMGRIGIRYDEVTDFFERLKSFPHLNVKGIMTHFAAAEDSTQNDFTTLQIKRFYDSVAIAEEKGFHPVYKDLANSPGAVLHKNSRGNLVRLGGILYGLGDDIFPEDAIKPECRHVMSIYSQVSHLKKVFKGETLGYNRSYRLKKDSVIATVPIGYYDGYRRALSNKGTVIINKTFAPVVGKISMDWIMIDVTDIPEISINEKVIIMGQDENLVVSAADIARLSDTISYEITCGISSRVRRVYEEVSEVLC